MAVVVVNTPNIYEMRDIGSEGKPQEEKATERPEEGHAVPRAPVVVAGVAREAGQSAGWGRVSLRVAIGLILGSGRPRLVACASCILRGGRSGRCGRPVGPEA